MPEAFLVYLVLVVLVAGKEALQLELVSRKGQLGLGSGLTCGFEHVQGRKSDTL